jgi:hypothetical protein
MTRRSLIKAPSSWRCSDLAEAGVVRYLSRMTTPREVFAHPRSLRRSHKYESDFPSAGTVTPSL